MARVLKRSLRGAADQTARVLGLLARRERSQLGALTVLTYHRVLPAERCVDYPFPSLAMPVEAFRAQVGWLAGRGEVLPLGQALERQREPGARTRPLYALTFDDGHHDAADCTAEVLEGAGVRGTFFVTTGFVGTDSLLWFDAAARLFAVLPDSARRSLVLDAAGTPAPALPDADRGAGAGASVDTGTSAGANAGAWAAALKACSAKQRRAVLAALESAAGGAPDAGDDRALSVAQLVALQRSGHEIGSHSVSHALLPQCDDAELEHEVQGAQRTLAGWLGAGVAGFCYPNGDQDPRVAAAVARAGHAYACTTRDGQVHAGDDRFALPRVDIVPARVGAGAGDFEPTAFRRELCGLYRERARPSPAAGRRA